MQQDRENRAETAAGSGKEPYQVERIFVGTRTAEQVVADLIRLHTEESDV